MNPRGLYVYGLIRAADAMEVGDVGLEHEGRPARVYSVVVDDVAAVVSPYDVRRKVFPLRRNPPPHHAVVATLTQATTVVPMTFGHVERSESDLVQSLRLNVPAIASAAVVVQVESGAASSAWTGLPWAGDGAVLTARGAG